MIQNRTLWPILLLAALGAVLARGDDVAEKGKAYWMKKKLEYSQNILAGLATEDFELIGKNARAMNKLNVLEQWLHAKSSAYRTQLKLFGFANRQLIRMADDENLDGCNVAYLQLTLSCIHCHRVVRDLNRGKSDSGEE